MRPAASRSSERHAARGASGSATAARAASSAMPCSPRRAANQAKLASVVASAGPSRRQSAATVRASLVPAAGMSVEPDRLENRAHRRLVGHQQERSRERTLGAFGAERGVDAEDQVACLLGGVHRRRRSPGVVGPIVNAGTDGSSIIPMKLLSAVR